MEEYKRIEGQHLEWLAGVSVMISSSPAASGAMNGRCWKIRLTKVG